MGQRTRNKGQRTMGRYIRVGMIVMAAAVLAGILPGIASSREEVRELRLVARDMTFYVEGQDAPNPTLRFKAGERIKLVLRNTDRGMSHDFVVPAWDVATTLVEGAGETSVMFRVPAVRGSQPYTCIPHAAMMRGTIHVE
jgi:plastocyanin